MRYCKFCGQEIPAGRLKILPNTTSCVPCVEKNGDVDTPVGIMIFSHKTAPEMVIVTKEQAEAMNRVDRRGYKKQGNKVWEDN